MTKYLVLLDDYEERAHIKESWTRDRMLKYADGTGANGRKVGEAETLPVAAFVYQRAKDLCKSYYFWTPGGRYIHFDYLYLIAAEYDDEFNELLEYGDVLMDYVSEIDERG